MSRFDEADAEAPAATTAGEMPPASPSMVRVVKHGYRAEPRLLLASLAMTLLQALPDVLVALWLALITDGLVHHHETRLYVGAFGLAASATLMWALSVTLDRTIRRLGDRLNIMFQGYVARLQAEVATVEHHERPVYLDRIAVLRTGVFALDHLFRSMFTMVGWLVRLAFVSVLLAAIHPAPAPAAPGRGAAAPRRGVAAQGREAHAEESVASARRGSRRHLFTGRDLDAAGQGDARHRQPGRPGRAPAYGAGAWFCAESASPTSPAPPGGRWPGRSSRSRSWPPSSGSRPGSTPVPVPSSWCSTAGGRLLGVRRLRGGRARLPARHLARLRPAPGLARGLRRRAERPRRPSRRPSGSSEGIRLRGRLVRLPRHRPARARSTSTWRCPPAASSRSSARTAPGKSTLVKLLARMYAPTSGRITADGVDIGRIDVARVARAARRRVPGLRPPRVRRRDHRRPRRRAAARRPGRRGRRGRPGRRDTGGRRPARRPRHPARALVGRAASTSASASGRSWLSPAATCAPEPLLLLLDEPTAALDAETEHALFERFAASAREADDERPGHGAGLPPVLDGPDGRPDRGARRRPGGRGRQPRRADGARRHLRRAVLHPGQDLRLTRARHHRARRDATRRFWA